MLYISYAIAGLLVCLIGCCCYCCVKKCCCKKKGKIGANDGDLTASGYYRKKGGLGGGGDGDMELESMSDDMTRGGDGPNLKKESK